MEIQFLGAVGTVTGSMHKISVDDKQILLDCGLFQGKRDDCFKLNQKFPFSPDSIHSILLSHAHIDHCGRIPLIAKQGFLGGVFCTGATLDLCSAILRDSALIQEKDIELINRRQAGKEQPFLQPLCTLADAELALYHFQGIGYKRQFHVLRDVKCTFFDAGHILGAAQILVEIKAPDDPECVKRIFYTGDIGRSDSPILKKPEMITDIDYLVIESTCGNRKYQPIEDVKKYLLHLLSRVIKRGGKIIIPAFSVGRTDEILFYIHQFIEHGDIPSIPIFIDSPLSVNVTEIFRHHSECYDSKTRDYLLDNENPFGFENLTYIRSVEKSKNLSALKDSCIIISASSMCESGRVLHHLAHTIEDKKNMVLFNGFMAQETLGRKLVDKHDTVNILGESFEVKAEIASINELSAHADSDELVKHVKRINSGTERKLSKVFVVHGEKAQSDALADRIKQEIGVEAVVPECGETFEL